MCTYVCRFVCGTGPCCMVRFVSFRLSPRGLFLLKVQMCLFSFRRGLLSGESSGEMLFCFSSFSYLLHAYSFA